MNNLKKIITPFEKISPNVKTTILVVHLLVFIGSWIFFVPMAGGKPTGTYFPNLLDVLSAWGDMWKHGLFVHILMTLQLCGIATLISIVFSCVVAYLSRTPLFAPLSYFITKLRYVPIQGLTIFLMQIGGGGRNLQVTLLVIFMSFYLVTALIAAIDDIPPEDLIRREAQKMNRWKILWKVVILDRADYLIEVVRQNLSITFMMIVSVEAMDKTQGGLGSLLVDTNRALAFPKIFALQLTILVIGISLDALLKLIFKSFPSQKQNN